MNNRYAIPCKTRFAVSAALSVLCLFGQAALFAQDATVPGAVSTPYPTITNLAVEWLIKGDDNLNAVCTVEYRIAGAQEWQKAMPLRRVPAGESRGTRPIFRWNNKFSGSIFDLKPGTEYEISLKLSDPDGGAAEKLVTARTRSIPRPDPQGTIKHCNADNFADSILGAHPGDIFILAPGYYDDFTLLRDGAPGRPIVIRSDRSLPELNSTFDQVSFLGRRHVILDGVTVNGMIQLMNTEDISIRYCSVNAKFGISARDPAGATNCYIADNVVTYIMPWIRIGMGAGLSYGGAACEGQGIEITGPGNVICYNRVIGYEDNIGSMEDLHTYDQICQDFYNNDVLRGMDDGIEADFSFSNCRIMRNRLTNCFMGLSSQPGLGGPNYFIRNVLYNIADMPFKLMRGSKGDVILHNTVIKIGDGLRLNNPKQMLFRNNLIIGGSGGGIYGRWDSGPGNAFSFPRPDQSCDMDYDGFGTIGTPFKGQYGKAEFTDLATLKNISPEKHAVQVDMGVFADKVDFPDPVFPERPIPNLMLRAGSAAVDAGVVIPNINDGFTGKGPDLGAYEVGQEMPIYGPRPQGVDEETEWNRLHGGK